MTLMLQKTEAEKSLAAQFDDVVATLPGVDMVAETRRKAIAQFVTSGLPHRRIEEWKYTDLRNRLTTAFPPALSPGNVSAEQVSAALGPVAGLDCAKVVFVDGRYAAGLSDVASLGEGVMFKPMAEALTDQCFADMHGKPNPAIDEADGVGALNTAFMSDGAGLFIQASPERTIHVVYVVSGQTEAAITTRNVIAVAAGVEATIIESFVALGDAGAQVNTLTHIGIDTGAKVTHVKVQRENVATTHLSNWHVDLAAEADYRGFQYSSGAALARNQIAVKYMGEGAKADVSGCKLIRGSQHCDTTMVVDHAVPECVSRELFKVVLDDTARGVFQGKVIVRPDAQKTDGKQMAQALMLSEACEFDSKPELEIYADDVVCGHGATCIEIDPDLVFYCRSRGIDEATARALITESFVAEAIETIEDEAISAALSECARAWLSNA